jgi:hypothetical protein
MKKEYEEKLEMARKKLAAYHAASQKDEEILLEVTRSLESLVLTEDTEVLCELFDFFISETADEYDMCETLEELVMGISLVTKLCRHTIKSLIHWQKKTLKGVLE